MISCHVAAGASQRPHEAERDRIGAYREHVRRQASVIVATSGGQTAVAARNAIGMVVRRVAMAATSGYSSVSIHSASASAAVSHSGSSIIM
jgi:hypothetical protein